MAGEEKIYELFHCTASMRQRMHQCLHYAALSGVDPEPEIARMLACGELPCRDKRSGMERIRQLEERIVTLSDDINQIQKQEDSDRESCALPGSFSAVYVERAAAGLQRTERILSHFSDLPVREIGNYKDVFYHSDLSQGDPERAWPDGEACRNHRRCLILARKQDHFVFPGAPVCQDFDESHFYYATSAMNCLYDCEYCYLKGMYPSSHPVLFVNPEDTFEEVDAMLREHPVYLCISYDTDLPAWESLAGLVNTWAEYAAGRPNLRIECRTKCARTDIWESLPVNGNFIFAFTLSPEPVIEAYEHRTPTLDSRLECIKKAQEAGHPVRLCFDPMIHVGSWQTVYEEMLQTVAERIDLTRVRDVSLGSFRISQAYLKRMRRRLTDSPVVQFPFENEEGVCQYPRFLREEMVSFMYEKTAALIPPEHIYVAGKSSSLLFNKNAL